MGKPQFSFIIPVYNRPYELRENLISLDNLKYKDFEVVIIEDGSTVSSQDVVEDYRSSLNITYQTKKNEGPSIARNYGAILAKGDYLIFVDSDCIMPRTYLDIITNELKFTTDVFGGPDRAHESFNTLQKAINFSMTSVLTTGGIRGQKKSVDRYYPRSFNLGIKRSVFSEMGGFPKTKMHPGEDMVFGIELIRRGYKTQYIHDAYVYHKRRTSLKQFYSQVRNFGKVRYYISRLYPDTFKITYLFPPLFCLYFILSVLVLVAGVKLPFYVLLLYMLMVFLLSCFYNKSIKTGLLSIITTTIQFVGYAVGIVSASLKYLLTGVDEYDVIGKDLFA